MNDIMMHVMDLVNNSVAAKANRIEMMIDVLYPKIVIHISDNGVGMNEEKCREVLSPFVTSRLTRNVGLGIPLCKLTSEQSGGNFYLESQLGVGTNVKFSFNLKHIDCPPVGNVGELFYLLMSTHFGIYFSLVIKNEVEKFAVNSLEIEEIISDVSLYNLLIKEWIIDYVNENYKIKVGENNEVTR